MKINLNRKYIPKKFLYPAAFLIPLAVMILCMVIFGVEPFGDKSFIIIDGLHQYMPFYSVLYDKLKTGDSLFYSFRAGTGINFLSLLSYYLSSPFNLLIIFFKKTQLNMAVSLMLVLKISLSGLTAAIYFGAQKKRASLWILALSCAYALNSYMVGYSWNIMWLDALMIFPLVMLGIERLIKKGKCGLYTLALFYALFCNYYIAFMICIFSVMWFITCRFSSIRHFIKSGLLFAWHSLLAAGMAAILLVPAWLGIRETASGEDMSLPAHSFITSFTDLLTRQFALLEPISHDNFDGNANLYFGMFAALAFFLYLCNTKIRLREKLARGLLLVFILVSCNEAVLNFIWHGFHDQYGIPNRFSFMYGFVLLYMLYQVITHYKGIEIWQPPLSAALLLGVIWISRQYAAEPLTDEQYFLAALLLFAYAVLLAALVRFSAFRVLILSAFTLLAAAEMCITCVAGFDCIGQISVSKFFSATEDMEEAAEKTEDGSFFRSELADGKIVDENAWYPLRAVGLFGSTAKHSMVEIMDSLGFYTGCNEYLYEGGTPVTNLLLGVRYLYYHSEDTLRSEFLYKDSAGTFDLFENPVDNLSLGYLMDEGIDNWYYESAYPFRVLNELCQYGWNSEEIFHNIEIPEPVTHGVSVNNTNDGEYHFFFENQEDDNLVFQIRLTQEAEHLYFHYDGTQVDYISIRVNDDIVESGDLDSRILYLGKAPQDSLVTITLRLKGEEEEGYVRLSMAELDQEAFDRMAEQVTAEGFRTETIESDYIQGSITADREQYLVFSIPYDTGWQVKVDGKNTETCAIGNAFLSVIIPEGQHEVTLSYTSPGFEIGWKISVCALLLFGLTCFLHKKRQASKK